MYQTLISPLTPASCRYQPTCSQYAKEALETHGFFKGWKLALKRMTTKKNPGAQARPFAKNVHSTFLIRSGALG